MTNFTNCPFQNHERIDFIYINYENTSSPVESKLHVCICAIAHLSLHFVRFSGYVISNVHRLSTVRASLSRWNLHWFFVAWLSFQKFWCQKIVIFLNFTYQSNVSTVNHAEDFENDLFWSFQTAFTKITRGPKKLGVTADSNRQRNWKMKTYFFVNKTYKIYLWVPNK